MVSDLTTQEPVRYGLTGTASSYFHLQLQPAAASASLLGCSVPTAAIPWFSLQLHLQLRPRQREAWSRPCSLKLKHTTAPKEKCRAPCGVSRNITLRFPLNVDIRLRSLTWLRAYLLVALVGRPAGHLRPHLRRQLCVVTRVEAARLRGVRNVLRRGSRRTQRDHHRAADG